MNLDSFLQIVAVVLVPAVGGLLAMVMRHGRLIASIQSEMDAWTRAVPQIQDDLRTLAGGQRDVAVRIAELHGDVRALRERSDSVLRTVARHEQFLYRTDGVSAT